MLKTSLATLTGVLAYLFGPPDKMFIFVAIMLVANFAYGLFVEKNNRKAFCISSIKRYIGYAGLIFVGQQIDETGIFASLGYDSSVRFLMFVYILSKEIRKFLHYLEALGVETPSFLDSGLRQVEEREANSTSEYEELALRMNRIEETIINKKNSKKAGPTENERGDL